MNFTKELAGTALTIAVSRQLDTMTAPAQFPGHLRAAIDSFVEDAPRFDDITMLSMLYHGGKEAES